MRTLEGGLHPLLPDFEIQGDWHSPWYPVLLHSRLLDPPPRGEAWTVGALSDATGILDADVLHTLKAMAARGIVVLERPGPVPREVTEIGAWFRAHRVRLPLDPALEGLSRWISAELEGAGW
ncbi:MAG TPA: hypothetical protein VNO79_10720 [Actinomycetota bacterium]|nr:hypothetical protein [Actinomycetota bacterium]